MGPFSFASIFCAVREETSRVVCLLAAVYERENNDPIKVIRMMKKEI